MKRLTLEAVKRELVGKKIKKIRKEGLIPASIYGKDIKSLAIQLPFKDFVKVYREVGQTGLIDLKVGSDVHPSLVKNVQVHPVSGNYIHVEFHKVNLTIKIAAKVPVELVGQSPAVADGAGLLLQTLSEIEVKALPTDLPEKIEVDAAKLAAVNDQVTVGDLAKITGVEILTAADSLIVRVAPAVSEEAKKAAEEEAAAAAAASGASETPAAEGATPSGAQAPTEPVKDAGTDKKEAAEKS